MRLLAAFLLTSVVFSGCLSEVLGGGGVDPRDIVSDDKYDTWVIEIDYEDGHRPSSSAISLLQSRMNSMVSKEQVIIRVDEQIPDQGNDISVADLQGLTSRYRDATIGNGQVVTHVLYLGGNSNRDSDDGSVLGVALGDHETVGMFHGTIQSGTGLGSLYTTTEVERVVLLHEIGHIIGLVDNGLKMQTNHEDSSHQGHSSNQDSVMYWQVESSNIFQRFLDGGLPDNFDANDRRDVCAAGGKGSC